MARFLSAQRTLLDDGTEELLFAGCWAIFSHGNVSGMGEALHGARDTLPTFRGHNSRAWRSPPPSPGRRAGSR